MGTWKVGESGMPIYEKEEYLPTIIHEFSHSFLNPLLAQNEESFEKSGKEIYNAVEYEMNQQPLLPLVANEGGIVRRLQHKNIRKPAQFPICNHALLRFKDL